MTQELRERVARVLAEFQGEIHEGTWKFYLKDADAAIALVLEEAAKVAMASPADYGSPRSYCEGRSAATAAIRALKNKP